MTELKESHDEQARLDRSPVGDGDGGYGCPVRAAAGKRRAAGGADGGVVQAVAFPFEIGKTCRLAAEWRGPRISVQVDGKPVTDWWDTADPIASGRVGLARKEGESFFAAVKVEPLPASTEAAPAHTPRFHERSWHGNQQPDKR